MTRTRLLRPADYRRTRWANDGGWTSEVTREPENHDAAFNWRVSIAEIESDGPFSRFPGITRDLLLLEGRGIELQIDAQPPQSLTDQLAHLRFDGASSVSCHLVDGPARDFNVMTRHDWGHADVTIHRSADAELSLGLASIGTTIVYAASGDIAVRGTDWRADVAAGETLRIDAIDADVGSLQLRGTGDAIVVRLTPRA